MDLWSVSAIVFFVNLPFGWWRVTARRFSLNWYLSIHVPVLLVVLLRIFAGVGWHPLTFPVLVVAFSAGQFAGGWLYRWWRKPTVTGEADN